MRAHPQLGAGPAVVLARAFAGAGARGEARDEGVGAAASPLVVLHGAAQAHEPRHRRGGRAVGAVGGGEEEAEAHPAAGAAAQAEPPLQ